MAFNKQTETNFLVLLLTMAITVVRVIATTNIDCKGKAFHCVNSTHFKICVDFGGVSKTVDEFLIPCPPSTVCTDNNYFECEYQIPTTPALATQSDVIYEITDRTVSTPWELFDVTTFVPVDNNKRKIELSEYSTTYPLETVSQAVGSETADIVTPVNDVSNKGITDNVIHSNTISELSGSENNYSTDLILNSTLTSTTIISATTDKLSTDISTAAVTRENYSGNESEPSIVLFNTITTTPLNAAQDADFSSTKLYSSVIYDNLDTPSVPETTENYSGNDSEISIGLSKPISETSIHNREHLISTNNLSRISSHQVVTTEIYSVDLYKPVTSISTDNLGNENPTSTTLYSLVNDNEFNQNKSPHSATFKSDAFSQSVTSIDFYNPVITSLNNIENIEANKDFISILASPVNESYTNAEKLMNDLVDTQPDIIVKPSTGTIANEKEFYTNITSKEFRRFENKMHEKGSDIHNIEQILTNTTNVDSVQIELLSTTAVNLDLNNTVSVFSVKEQHDLLLPTTSSSTLNTENSMTKSSSDILDFAISTTPYIPNTQQDIITTTDSNLPSTQQNDIVSPPTGSIKNESELYTSPRLEDSMHENRSDTKNIEQISKNTSTADSVQIELIPTTGVNLALNNTVHLLSIKEQHDLLSPTISSSTPNTENSMTTSSSDILHLAISTSSYIPDSTITTTSSLPSTQQVDILNPSIGSNANETDFYTNIAFKESARLEDSKLQTSNTENSITTSSSDILDLAISTSSYIPNTQKNTIITTAPSLPSTQQDDILNPTTGSNTNVNDFYTNIVFEASPRLEDLKLQTSNTENSITTSSSDILDLAISTSSYIPNTQKDTIITTDSSLPSTQQDGILNPLTGSIANENEFYTFPKLKDPMHENGSDSEIVSTTGVNLAVNNTVDLFSIKQQHDLLLPTVSSSTPNTENSMTTSSSDILHLAISTSSYIPITQKDDIVNTPTGSIGNENDLYRNTATQASPRLEDSIHQIGSYRNNIEQILTNTSKVDSVLTDFKILNNTVGAFSIQEQHDLLSPTVNGSSPNTEGSVTMSSSFILDLNISTSPYKANTQQDTMITSDFNFTSTQQDNIVNPPTESIANENEFFTNNEVKTSSILEDSMHEIDIDSYIKRIEQTSTYTTKVDFVVTESLPITAVNVTLNNTVDVFLIKEQHDSILPAINGSTLNTENSMRKSSSDILALATSTDSYIANTQQYAIIKDLLTTQVNVYNTTTSNNIEYNTDFTSTALPFSVITESHPSTKNIVQKPSKDNLPSISEAYNTTNVQKNKKTTQIKTYNTEFYNVNNISTDTVDDFLIHGNYTSLLRNNDLTSIQNSYNNDEVYPTTATNLTLENTVAEFITNEQTLSSQMISESHPIKESINTLESTTVKLLSDVDLITTRNSYIGNVYQSTTSENFPTALKNVNVLYTNSTKESSSDSVQESPVISTSTENTVTKSSSYMSQMIISTDLDETNTQENIEVTNMNLSISSINNEPLLYHPTTNNVVKESLVYEKYSVNTSESSINVPVDLGTIAISKKEPSTETYTDLSETQATYNPLSSTTGGKQTDTIELVRYDSNSYENKSADSTRIIPEYSFNESDSSHIVRSTNNVNVKLITTSARNQLNILNNIDDNPNFSTSKTTSKNIVDNGFTARQFPHNTKKHISDYISATPLHVEDETVNTNISSMTMTNENQYVSTTAINWNSSPGRTNYDNFNVGLTENITETSITASSNLEIPTIINSSSVVNMFPTSTTDINSNSYAETKKLDNYNTAQDLKTVKGNSYINSNKEFSISTEKLLTKTSNNIVHSVTSSIDKDRNNISSVLEDLNKLSYTNPVNHVLVSTERPTQLKSEILDSKNVDATNTSKQITSQLSEGHFQPNSNNTTLTNVSYDNLRITNINLKNGNSTLSNSIPKNNLRVDVISNINLMDIATISISKNISSYDILSSDIYTEKNTSIERLKSWNSTSGGLNIQDTIKNKSVSFSNQYLQNTSSNTNQSTELHTKKNNINSNTNQVLEINRLKDVEDTFNWGERYKLMERSDIRPTAFTNNATSFYTSKLENQTINNTTPNLLNRTQLNGELGDSSSISDSNKHNISISKIEEHFNNLSFNLVNVTGKGLNNSYDIFPNKTTKDVNYLNALHVNAENKQNKEVPVLRNEETRREGNIKITTVNINKNEYTKFSCNNHHRGKYSDKFNCQNFYICIGRRNEPIFGKCPNNTVFSEISKQCTKNLSHCIRNNQFQCTSEGRYLDIFSDQFYYICVKKVEGYIRFKLKCMTGYHLNKSELHCVLDSFNGSKSNEDSSKINSEKSTIESKSKEDLKKEKKEFECKKVGKFVYQEDCRKYYHCTRGRKSEYRRKIKKCDSDEVFNNEKEKCVDEESYEC